MPRDESNPDADLQSWVPAQVIPGTSYELLDAAISEGGYGRIYKVRHTMTGRVSAVKALHRALTNRDDILLRFQQEVRVIAQILPHPNVVDIYDAGYTSDGRFYYVMELLEGESLRQAIHQVEKLPVPDACHVIRQVLLALAKAHAHGIVHRDLKPENIFLVRTPNEATSPVGLVKLLDFGVAKVFDSPLVKTVPGTIVGTLKYFAPENVLGQPIRPQSDIYSLGVTFWETLMGAHPFPYKDQNETVRAIVQQGIPKLHELSYMKGVVSRELSDVIACATAREPRHRFPSVLEFLAALEKVMGEHETRSSSLRPPERSRPRENAVRDSQREPEPIRTTVPRSYSATTKPGESKSLHRAFTVPETGAPQPQLPRDTEPWVPPSQHDAAKKAQPPSHAPPRSAREHAKPEVQEQNEHNFTEAPELDERLDGDDPRRTRFLVMPPSAEPGRARATDAAQPAPGAHEGSDEAWRTFTTRTAKPLVIDQDVTPTAATPLPHLRQPLGANATPVRVKRRRWQMPAGCQQGMGKALRWAQTAREKLTSDRGWFRRAWWVVGVAGGAGLILGAYWLGRYRERVEPTVPNETLRMAAPSSSIEGDAPLLSALPPPALVPTLSSTPVPVESGVVLIGPPVASTFVPPKASTFVAPRRLKVEKRKLGTPCSPSKRTTHVDSDDRRRRGHRSYPCLGGGRVHARAQRHVRSGAARSNDLAAPRPLGATLDTAMVSAR